MARSIWKGSLSFGLVSIPVALYPAEKPEELSFHQLDRRDLGLVGYKRINKKTEKEVPWDQIVRGYEYRRGSYVVLTDQDLKRANVGRGATSVSAYSTRARAGAPVSMPLAWEELDLRLRPDAWAVENAKQRLRRKDPWTGFYACRQSITASMRRAVGLGATRER